MDLKKIQSNAGGQTPSTGQELVDAFNENFELVDKNKADKDLTNVTDEDLVKVLYGPDYDSNAEAFREFITTVPESLKVINKSAIDNTTSSGSYIVIDKQKTDSSYLLL
ncbi:hypothetical protein, partial [Coprobacter fastidiosus]|uniref:hypothetical protein n=1 Tax=Coprobacter fastidiosus TaxID=1099853 RepID=UPI003AAE9C66